MDAPAVSLVATVYNERHSIDRLLDSLAAQTRLPDEVVICDGGSTDGTAEYVRERLLGWKDGPAFKLLVEKGANISRGRNLAIGAAQGPIIAVTDAGVRLDANWLAELVRPWDELAANGQDLARVAAVAGFFTPDAQGVFQTAMAATVLPLEDDIVPEKFLPSSRSVAFLKSAWRAAGEYPEWLDYCEDLVFDMRLQDVAADRSCFVWRPGARVYFRPREDLRAFWRQYYLYARGDGKAGLWGKRHALRYFVYLALTPALVGHALWGKRAPGLGLAALLVGFVAYLWRPWQRVIRIGRELSWVEVLAALALAPVIRVVGDLAKMAGYPVGLKWRREHAARPEIHWRRGSPTRNDDRS